MTDARRPAHRPSGRAEDDQRELFNESAITTGAGPVKAPDSKTHSSSWKKDVSLFYSSSRLSEQTKSRIYGALRNCGTEAVETKHHQLNVSTPVTAVDLTGASKNTRPTLSLGSSIKRIHNSGLGYFITAAAAGLAALAFTRFFQESPNDQSVRLAEFANQMVARSYPADFDLEGDSAGLKEALQEVFPQKELYLTDLPREILGDYRPSEGRFFLWSGEPGVSIQLRAANQKGLNSGSDKPATLYVVKLSEKNKNDFPKKQVTKRLANKTGESSRKIDVWRDENFGYAMVQTVAFGDP